MAIGIVPADPGIMDEMEGRLDETKLFIFFRTVRTETSESYSILDGADQVGQVDLHFSLDVAHATVILTKVLSEEDLREMITAIDEQLVSSVLPSYDRLDFITSVYHGSEIGTFSDPSPDEELGTDNGH